MNSRIFEAIEESMLMEDFMKGDYQETSLYDSYKFLDSDLYCDECNIWENMKI